MPSLVLCYAPDDEEPARQLGDYLAANLAYDVSLGECVIGPSFDLIDATDQALSAEVALVLLSPRSVPKAWTRDRWEPVFFQKPAEFGSLLGFVLLRECRFPDLIRRRNFFDATSDLLAETRRIKRWLLRPGHPPESVPNLALSLLADQPATAGDVDYLDATSFASLCEMDFESVHRFDCAGRTRAGILGGIGHAIQMRLPGTVEENRRKLADWFGDHRRLLLFSNSAAEDRDFLTFGGLASTIFTVNCPARQRANEDQIGDAFLAAIRDESTCAALVPDAVACSTDLLDSDFESGLRLGWAVVSVLRAAERFAEAVEILDLMEKAARSREDSLALYRIEWEQSWLRETSPEDGVMHILPTASEEITQLSLF